MKIEKVYINDAQYPKALKEISDPPNPLYYTGDIALASQRCVAVVGSRQMTGYGSWAAFKLGERLGEQGIPVVSGLAKGIDARAHEGALRSGTTIAVLGCGINICYPASNKKLRDEIAKQGLILSEYADNIEPARYRFPRRNRIISGLAEATVVVQAGNSSGALITAELAAEQGRTVYAVPGNINSAYNLGSNKLLKDGATPLVVIDDILTDMGISKTQCEAVKNTLGMDETLILSALEKKGEMTVDEIADETGHPVQKVSGIVTVLEMKGVVFTSLGKVFIAK